VLQGRDELQIELREPILGWQSELHGEYRLRG